MTEDETFRRLKQLPFEEVERRHYDINTIGGLLNLLKQRVGTPPSKLEDINYESMGWTQQEFINEWIGRYPKYSLY